MTAKQTERIVMERGAHRLILENDAPGYLVAWLETDNDNEAVMVATTTDPDTWDVKYGYPADKQYVLSFHATLDGKPPFFATEWQSIVVIAQHEAEKLLDWTARVGLQVTDADHDPYADVHEQYSMYGSPPPAPCWGGR